MRAVHLDSLTSLTPFRLASAALVADLTAVKPTRWSYRASRIAATSYVSTRRNGLLRVSGRALSFWLTSSWNIHGENRADLLGGVGIWRLLSGFRALELSI